MQSAPGKCPPSQKHTQKYKTRNGQVNVHPLKHTHKNTRQEMDGQIVHPLENTHKNTSQEMDGEMSTLSKTHAHAHAQTQGKEKPTKNKNKRKKENGKKAR